MDHRDINKEKVTLSREKITNTCYCERQSLGIRLCFFVMFLEMLVLIFTKEQNHGIYALLFSFSCADGFVDYRLKKKKFYLVSSAVSLILAVYSFYLFVMGAIG